MKSLTVIVDLPLNKKGVSFFNETPFTMY